ncbi:hypothetical protein SAMN05421858_1272 [Haladaptatus litoreus]|uniref:DUF7992 domain-containing protein n=1 Tax=Haladaptatus litoreus TaxID=553468 RepID=A0A1N6XTT5_9EURY|nr:hypothetical protein [Haladaptatus litoreus]SIR05724.1 hypothetical protein SAMN05421858_1272 [Haladaptatus litoreus]
MSLDVSTPDAPTIDGEREDQYEPDGENRGDLQEYLDGEENAWEEGFREWAAETPLSEESYRVLLDLDLLSDLDFFWDEESEEVQYESPEIENDWEELHPSLDSWSQVSEINEELDELGETVAGVLSDYYVAWDEEAEVTETFGEQYNARDDALPENERNRDE